MNERNAYLKKLYTGVFEGRENYIPIIISPPCPDGPTVDQLWQDLETAVEKTARSLESKKQVGSDWIPSLNIGLYQCIAIPSLFGAEVIKLEGSEPICHPCLKSIDHALEFGIPKIESPVIDRMMNDIRIAQRSLSEQGYLLSFPAVASPFDLAQLMLGEEFLLSLVLTPDKAKSFLANLTELAVSVINMVKAEMGQAKDECVTNRGMFFPGQRLPCDAIVNYSPEIIENFVIDVLDIFAKEFSALCIHFCTEPAPSGHVLPELLKSKFVKAVDNWQGPDVFIGEESPVRMQEKIAVVSSLDLSTTGKINAFFDREPVREIKRNGGRGMVVATDVQSVDDGKRIYQIWQERFVR